MNDTNGEGLRYRFAAHAKSMLIERGISIPWIHRVMANPLTLERDKEDPTLTHALGRISERGDMILRVVYNETTKPQIIVTAFFDRRASRKL